ncbi:hypothetical protein NFI96_022286 [Prochilodus magdalenae]|nr:hypothetical protein NFI96_022286 [Prochilodus magdalenae]
MWNGIKALTDYKTNTPQASDDTSLPDVLNQFFARYPRKLLVNFYRSTIESILSHCMIIVWYSSCTVSERKDLHRVVKVAGRIIGTDLPSLAQCPYQPIKEEGLQPVCEPSLNANGLRDFSSIVREDVRDLMPDIVIHLALFRISTQSE